MKTAVLQKHRNRLRSSHVLFHTENMSSDNIFQMVTTESKWKIQMEAIDRLKYGRKYQKTC